MWRCQRPGPGAPLSCCPAGHRPRDDVRGAWPAQCVEHVTCDLGVVTLSLTLSVEITFKNKCKRKLLERKAGPAHTTPGRHRGLGTAAKTAASLGKFWHDVFRRKTS